MTIIIKHLKINSIILFFCIALISCGNRNKCGGSSLFGSDNCHWVSTAKYSNDQFFDGNIINEVTVIDSSTIWFSGFELNFKFNNYFIQSFIWPTYEINDTNFLDTTGAFDYVYVFLDSTEIEVTTHFAWHKLKFKEPYSDDVSDTHGSHSIYEYQLFWNNKWILGEFEFFHRLLD